MHISRFRRLLLGITTLVVLLTGVWVSLPSYAATPAGGTNSAQILVAFGGGDTVVKTVTFTESTISGLEALERAFTLDTDSGAVCSIETTGCPSTDCFCAFPAYYWQYLHQGNGEWLYSDVGPAEYELQDGDVEAWVWAGALPPPTDTIFSAQAALDYMRPFQQANGSYNNNVGGTIEATFAIAAANADTTAWATEGGASINDFLTAQGLTYATGAAQTGKLALGVATAGMDPRDFVGADLVLSLTTYYSPTTGAFGVTNWDQSLAMLGWRAAGEGIPLTATNQLRSRVNTDGGWGYAPGSDSDTDSTSLVLEALVAGGEPLTSTAIINGLGYLEDVQEADGGFPYQPNFGSNTNSTGYGLQGIIAGGADPLTLPYTISGTSPISYLLDMQTDEGGFAFVDVNDGPDLFATVQTIPGLVGKPFPYLSNAVAERKAVNWVLDQQQEDGSFDGFNPGATLDAAMALEAAGIDPLTLESPTGNTPLDYIVLQAETYATGASAAGKLTVGAIAAGGNPRDLGGFDAVTTLTEFYSPTTGAFGTDTFAQAWGLLGYAASGTEIPSAAIDYAKSIAADGGGWGFNPNAPAGEADATGLMLQALAAAGVPREDATVLEAIAFLHSLQNGDGGFPGFDSLTSPSSTGLVLQAFAAYGEAPDSLDWTTVIEDGSASALTLQTPADRILTFQSLEGGFSGFSGPNDPYSTYQALIGIVGAPYVSATPPASPVLYLPLIFVETE
jgi:prenyltransferase beta subunit